MLFPVFYFPFITTVFEGEKHLLKRRYLCGIYSHSLSKEINILIIDAEDNLILKAEIPGIEANDLDISVTKDSVAIKAERKYDQQQKYLSSEFRYGKFERSIR